MSHFFKILFLAGLLLQFATGCATITSGTDQSVYIDTPRVAGAQCTLTDTKGNVWHLPQSPDTINVDRGDGPMTIVCEKPGYETVTKIVEEDLAGTILGNILIGGGIGIIIDIASGAAQEYPDNIVIWMRPDKWESKEDEAAWEKNYEMYKEKIKQEEKENALPENGEPNYLN